MPAPTPSTTTLPTAKASTDEAATKTYTVAGGRTVQGDGDAVGPGEKIDLDPKEGARLQKLGFLLSDAGDVRIDEKAGPQVVQGTEIKEA